MSAGHRTLAVGAAATAIAGAVALVAGSSLAGLLRRTEPEAERRGWWVALDTAPPADLLAGVAAGVLLGCTAWLWAAALTTLARVAAGTDPRHRNRGVPIVLHRAVLAGCGLALAGGTLSPAAAVPTPLHEEPRQVPLRSAAGAPAPAPTRATTWRVRRGDTLWGIARSSLVSGSGTSPSDREVAARVRLLRRLNRAAVPDPDLIHPTQRLRLPSP